MTIKCYYLIYSLKLHNFAMYVPESYTNLTSPPWKKSKTNLFTIYIYNCFKLFKKCSQILLVQQMFMQNMYMYLALEDYLCMCNSYDEIAITCTWICFSGFVTKLYPCSSNELRVKTVNRHTIQAHITLYDKLQPNSQFFHLLCDITQKLWQYWQPNSKLIFVTVWWE